MGHNLPTCHRPTLTLPISYSFICKIIYGFCLPSLSFTVLYLSICKMKRINSWLEIHYKWGHSCFEIRLIWLLIDIMCMSFCLNFKPFSIMNIFFHFFCIGPDASNNHFDCNRIYSTDHKEKAKRFLCMLLGS